MNPNFTSEMDEFLQNPDELLADRHYDAGDVMFTKNPQFLFFGYPSFMLNDRNSDNNFRFLIFIIEENILSS